MYMLASMSRVFGRENREQRKTRGRQKDDGLWSWNETARNRRPFRRHSESWAGNVGSLEEMGLRWAFQAIGSGVGSL